MSGRISMRRGDTCRRTTNATKKLPFRGYYRPTRSRAQAQKQHGYAETPPDYTTPDTTPDKKRGGPLTAWTACVAATAADAALAPPPTALPWRPAC